MDQDDAQLAAYLEDQELVDRKFSDKVAKLFDDIGTTPNRLTMWRILLTLPMTLFFTLAAVHTEIFWYWLFWHSAGAILFAWCGLLDFFDGALARYQNKTHSIIEETEEEENKRTFWAKLNLRGSSHFGAFLDPLSDKTLYFGAIVPLGLKILHPALLFGSLFIAFLLTVIRLNVVRKVFNLVGKSSANRMGKIKLITEVVAVAALGLLPSGPVQFHLANTAVGIALFIATLSFSGHAWLGYKRAVMLRRAKKTRS